MGNTKKSRVDLILSISLGGLILLVMLFIFCGYLQGKANREFNRANDCANMNSNWTYEKDGLVNTIGFPNKLNYKYGETIVLTNTIPNDFEDGFYIYVHTNYCSVDAYIDGLEAQVVGIDFTKDNHTYENPIVVIEVPDGAAGKQIDLHIVNNGSKFRIEVYDVLYGVKNEVRFKLTSNVIPIICATVVMVSLAIMFMIYSFFIHEQYKEISEDYACLAIFILLSAIWIFTDLSTQGAYFVGSESLYLAHIFSYILFPIPFIMYINKQLEKRSKFLRFQTTAQMIFVVLIMFFFLFNIFKMAYVMIASHILMVMILSEIFTILIHNFVAYKKNNLLIIIAIASMGLTGSMTLVNFYFNVSYDNTFAYKYGLIIFTVLASVYAIMRGFKSISDKKTSDATYRLNEEFNIITNKRNILVAKYFLETNLINYSFEGYEKSISPQDFIKNNSTNKYASAIMDFFYSIKQAKPKGEVGFEGTLFNKKGYYRLDYELVLNKDNTIAYALLNFADQTDAHMQEEILNKATQNAIEVVKRGGSYYRFNLEKNILEESENNLFEEEIETGINLSDFANYINKYVLSESDKAMVNMMFSYEKLYSIYGRDAGQSFEVKLNIDDVDTWVRFSIECYSSIDEKAVIAYIKVENIETQKKYVVDSNTGIDRISELLNANSFKTEVKVLLDQLDSSKKHTLMLIQINDYEHIIEEFGNSITNLIVKDLAMTLKSITRTTDTIGRVSIDTFALFIPYSPFNDTSNVYLIERINEAVKKTYYDKLSLTCSLGVAIYPNDGLSFDKLLMNAQSALNMASSEGRGTYVYFNSEINKQIDSELESFEERIKPLFNYANINKKELKVINERYRSVIVYISDNDLNIKVKDVLQNDFYIVDVKSKEEVKKASLQEVELACIITGFKDDDLSELKDICSWRNKKASINDIGIINIGSNDKADIDLYNIGVNDIILDKDVDEKLIRSIYKICAKRKNDERQAYLNAKAFIEKNSKS